MRPRGQTNESGARKPRVERSRLVTTSSLAADLGRLGLHAGDVVIAHVSLSSLGWVCGGAVAVILALQQVLNSTGTLVMPAHSSALCDPKTWQNPPVPKSWWRRIRAEMPAFDKALTPTHGVGIVAEVFRGQRGVVRSGHPLHSFCAWGKCARLIVRNHSLDFGLGEDSPLARLYDLDAKVLLLGCGHESNTSLHLAEYRCAWSGGDPIERCSPCLVGGARRWVTFKDIDTDSDDFARLGKALMARRSVTRGQVGCTRAMLMRQRELVDFAVDWLPVHRH